MSKTKYSVLKKQKTQYWKGFMVGISISAFSNLITFQDVQLLNVFVGGILGIFIYEFFGIQS